MDAPELLAALLERAGFAAPGALAPLAREARASGRPLVRVLSEQPGPAAAALPAALARAAGWPLLDGSDLDPSPAALALVDRAWIAEHLVVPLGFAEDTGALRVAAADPSRRAPLEALAALTGRPVEPGVVPVDAVDRVLAGPGSPAAPDPALEAALLALRPAFDGQQDAVRSLHAIFELCVARGVITREEYLARLAADPG